MKIDPCFVWVQHSLRRLHEPVPNLPLSRQFQPVLNAFSITMAKLWICAHPDHRTEQQYNQPLRGRKSGMGSHKHRRRRDIAPEIPANQTPPSRTPQLPQVEQPPPIGQLPRSPRRPAPNMNGRQFVRVRTFVVSAEAVTQKHSRAQPDMARYAGWNQILDFHARSGGYPSQTGTLPSNRRQRPPHPRRGFYLSRQCRCSCSMAYLISSSAHPLRPYRSPRRPHYPFLSFPPND